MAFSYPKQEHLTLPSVESVHILRDPPKSIHTRKIERVEGGDTHHLIRADNDRLTESIQRFPRGVNPMVSVMYSGPNAATPSSIETSQASLPYKVMRDGVFRPPLQTQEDLLPLSRQKRNWIVAQTRPGGDGAFYHKTLTEDNVDTHEIKKITRPGLKPLATQVNPRAAYYSGDTHPENPYWGNAVIDHKRITRAHEAVTSRPCDILRIQDPDSLPCPGNVIKIDPIVSSCASRAYGDFMHANSHDPTPPQSFLHTREDMPSQALSSSVSDPLRFVAHEQEQAAYSHGLSSIRDDMRHQHTVAPMASNLVDSSPNNNYQQQHEQPLLQPQVERSLQSVSSRPNLDVQVSPIEQTSSSSYEATHSTQDPMIISTTSAPNELGGGGTDEARAFTSSGETDVRTRQPIHLSAGSNPTSGGGGGVQVVDIDMDRLVQSNPNIRILRPSHPVTSAYGSAIQPLVTSDIDGHALSRFVKDKPLISYLSKDFKIAIRDPSGDVSMIDHIPIADRIKIAAQANVNKSIDLPVMHDTKKIRIKDYRWSVYSSAPNAISSSMLVLDSADYPNHRHGSVRSDMAQYSVTSNLEFEAKDAPQPLLPILDNNRPLISAFTLPNRPYADAPQCDQSYNRLRSSLKPGGFENHGFQPSVDRGDMVPNEKYNNNINSRMNSNLRTINSDRNGGMLFT